MEASMPARLAIYRLSELQPSKPLRFGLGKMVFAVAAIAGAKYPFLDFGFCLFETRSAVGILFGIAMFITSAVLLVVGGYLLIDGMLSLTCAIVKPRWRQSESFVYYHNSGYLHQPSIADRLFGKRIVPVDSAKLLESEKNTMLFLNGLTIEIVSERIEYVSTEAGDSYTTIFDLNLRCVFMDGPLKAKYTTGDETRIKRFRRNLYSRYYVVANYKKGILHIRDLGPAITEEER